MFSRIAMRQLYVTELALAVLIALLTSSSQAAVLVAVDIGMEPQAVEPGFTGYSAPALAEFEPQAFPGGTWDIDVTDGLSLAARNYGNIETSPGGDLLEDSVLANQTQSNPDFFFELVLDELAPGDYNLTTYHHSFAFGGATAEVSVGADSASLVILGTITSTTGTNISGATELSVDFTVTSEADGFTVRFRPTNASGSFHFDLSGFELVGSPDTDGDGVADSQDNCTTIANADQRDTDEDNIGNACDTDLNGDCSVNFGDLAELKAVFFPAPYEEDADFDGDGFVNFGDLASMKSAFFNGPAPGPGPGAPGNTCE